MINTNYFLAKTNAGNSLLIVNGDRWIDFNGDSQGMQDGFDLYEDDFVTNYKKMINDCGTESFENLWNDYKDNYNNQVTAGTTEDIEEFFNEFENTILIITIEE